MKYVSVFIAVFIAVSCNSTKEITIKKSGENSSAAEVKLPDSLIKKLQKGIDFFADGNTPSSWTLEMDYDNGYYFKTSNGIIMNTPAFKAVISDDTLRKFIANTSQGEMTIFLYETVCGNKNAKRSEVLLNNTLYTGCGNYLYNPAIDGKWILEKIGNTVVNGSDFKKGIPTLQFDISGNKIIGTDGCNNINAEIQMQGSRIQFSTINGSKAACSNNTLQKIFLEKISGQVASYYFKDGRLYLYLIDDSLLIYKKG